MVWTGLTKTKIFLKWSMPKSILYNMEYRYTKGKRGVSRHIIDMSKEILRKHASILKPEYVDMIDLYKSSIVHKEKGWMSQEVLNVSIYLLYYFIHVL